MSTAATVRETLPETLTQAIHGLLPDDAEEWFIRSDEHEEYGELIHTTALLARRNGLWLGRVIRITEDNDISVSQLVEVDIERLPQGYKTMRQTLLDEEVIREAITR